jgi:hypothetical protein
MLTIPKPTAVVLALGIFVAGCSCGLAFANWYWSSHVNAALERVTGR